MSKNTNKNLKKKNFLFSNFRAAFLNKKLFFLINHYNYQKSKINKTRLFCKSIFFFALLLNFILVSELQFLYYFISVNLSNLFLILSSIIILLIIFYYIRLRHIKLSVFFKHFWLF